MKFKILFLFILMIGLVSASSSVDLNYADEDRYEYKEVGYSTVVVNLQTFEESVCKYSVVEDVNWTNAGNFFYVTGGIKNHKNTFVDLSEGPHKFFINCRNVSGPYGDNVLKLVLDVNSYISADIDLSKLDPVSAGKLDIDLKTSKIVSGVPVLRYSLDSKSYSSVPLTGSKKDWQGYIIIPSDAGEGILSFEFEARDLEGRLGSLIASGGVYYIDTISPEKIESLDVDDEGDYVEVSWKEIEGVEDYNIYRSEDTDVGEGDYYNSVDRNYFRDYDIDEGEVFYYRVAARDEAGNLGELSEIFHYRAETSSDNKGASKLSGLLIPKVDGFLEDISYLKQEVVSVKHNFNNLEGEEGNFFDILNIDSELGSIERELGSIEGDAKRLKNQDLEEEELDNKLDNLYARLRVLEKNMPSSLSVLDSIEKDNAIEDRAILDALKEENKFLSEGEYEDYLDITRRLMDENELDVASVISKIEVRYNDGTKKIYSFLERRYDSVLEKVKNAYFVEMFPESLSQALDSVKVENINYDLNVDKNAIYFNTDTKKVSYYFEEDVYDKLGAVEPAMIYMPSFEGGGLGITGYAVFDVGSGSSFVLIVVGGVFFILLGIFLFFKYKRKRLPKEAVNLIFSIETKLSEGDLRGAKKDYLNLKNLYSSFDSKEKKRTYKEIKKLQREILILEFEKNLDKYNQTKDREIMKKLQRVFDSFPEDLQKKVRKSFEEIKGDK